MVTRRTKGKEILKPKYRSTLEARIVPPLLLLGALYEPVFLRYPVKARRYYPDVVLPNGIALELKGFFKPSDRAKMIAVKAAYPDLDIRMVLQAPYQKLNKTSQITLATWCNIHRFPWADNDVPQLWLDLPVNKVSLYLLGAPFPENYCGVAA